VSVPVQESMLATELWVSFGSLLRSYTAAASLNLAKPAEVAIEGNRIEAVAGAAVLSIQYDPERRTGQWVLRAGTSCEEPENSGAFELLPEGAILLEGRTIDLDHAAIDFAAALMLAAAKPAGTEI
jgi:hypothetical protein